MEWELTCNWKEWMEAAETSRVHRRWLRNTNSKAIPRFLDPKASPEPTPVGRLVGQSIRWSIGTYIFDAFPIRLKFITKTMSRVLFGVDGND